MMPGRDALNLRLLDEWQRDFPLKSRPFAVIGARFGMHETEVIDRFASLINASAVTRIGATLSPNTAGASTLAALAAPPERVETIAATIGAEPGVNHSYLREHHWNLWFVATGPDREAVRGSLARIAWKTGQPVLDLPLLRPFVLDLGFPLDGGRARKIACRVGDRTAIRPGDRAILQALTDGLPLVPRPFAAIGEALELAEAAVIERIGALSAAGIISRFGVIVRHRALGWTSNAMVVWDVSHEEAGRAGPILAAQQGITLCYERRPAPPAWPHRLFAMIHARSRAEAMAVLGRASAVAGLGEAPHAVLFSLRCFKQRGALVDADRRMREVMA